MAYSKEQAKQYRKKLYDFCTQHQICHNCYSKDILTENGRAYCAECAEKQNEYKRNYVDKEHRKMVRKKLRQKHIDNHECVVCGQTLSEKYKFKTCQSCLAKKRNNWRKNHPDAFTRGEYGICWLCNKELALEGQRLCKNCYEKNYIVRGLLKPNNSNHLWRRMKYGKNNIAN